MDFETPPQKPIVVSQWTATKDAEVWTRWHDFRKIYDGSGLAWHLKQRYEELPNPPPSKTLTYRITLWLEATPHSQDLIGTGTLILPEDKRLAAWIHTTQIPMTLKPHTLTSTTKDQLEQIVSVYLMDLKTKFQSHMLHLIKRRLLAQWLDQRCLFAYSK